MKLKHYDHDGRARFVTFGTHQGIPVLSNSKFRDIVVDCLYEACKQHECKLIGYVIMPEHVHAVVVPPIEAELGFVIGELKRISARRIHTILVKGSGKLEERLTTVRNGVKRFSLWQRRCFDHNCRTIESVWEKVNYCHTNPVKRGLAKTSRDWKWSSIHYYLDAANTLFEIDVSTR